ncbi:hypothetical protein GDO78_001655 [Eleutherodactylus coqui]|uniref:Uncharacterized protein n=1 Tax=Eleutherodactylus coqui TaxID=57060 RepID=A0A8J6FUG9_ELECQ|nr:hypothetical protein GDO78_001655 [Eleutherodactylus coqui]
MQILEVLSLETSYDYSNSLVTKHSFHCYAAGECQPFFRYHQVSIVGARGLDMFDIFKCLYFVNFGNGPWQRFSSAPHSFSLCGHYMLNLKEDLSALLICVPFPPE